MNEFFWWLKHIVLVLVSGIFLTFGFQLFKAAYTLNDPFSFVLTFFASNFMILISAALMIGFVWRMAVALRKECPDKDGK